MPHRLPRSAPPSTSFFTIWRIIFRQAVAGAPILAHFQLRDAERGLLRGASMQSCAVPLASCQSGSKSLAIWPLPRPRLTGGFSHTNIRKRFRVTRRAERKPPVATRGGRQQATPSKPHNRARRTRYSVDRVRVAGTPVREAAMRPCPFCARPLSQGRHMQARLRADPPRLEISCYAVRRLGEEPATAAPWRGPASATTEGVEGPQF
jgi:hypothetical protein